MAFTRDWDEAAPIDHTLNREWPGKDRNVKVDISDRIKSWIAGFISGEATAGVKYIPFIDQAGNPSTITDQFLLFGKAVAGKTELHMKDEDGNVVQLSDGGKLRSLALKATAVADITNLMELIYPVGSVVTLGVSTNPATLYGVGTWIAIAGKVIVGIDAGQTEFDTLDETGGEKTHTLSSAEMPSHQHSITIDTRYDNSGAGFANAAVQAQAVNGSFVNQASGFTGGGGAHNNLQPYIVKYVWQRTA
jgi:hypothetical protein